MPFEFNVRWGGNSTRGGMVENGREFSKNPLRFPEWEKSNKENKYKYMIIT
jgi:hypothetical protein